MEENVALNTSKQKQFVKSIKGLKNLIIKNENESINAKQIKSQKNKRSVRGLVYLAHIPHGFYENEMTQYFSQFGCVTNVRVIRSPRTGNSKGFAFVEFKEPTVAEIVADTMNNYLMGKRLLKAQYIPPEKQNRHAFRKKWNPINNPGRNLQIKLKQAYNTTKDQSGELKRAKKLLSNLSKTKKKLRELGLNYDFFAPVDIPEELDTSFTEKQGVAGENKDNNKIKQQKVKLHNDKSKEVIGKEAPVEDKLLKHIIRNKRHERFDSVEENEKHKFKQDSLKDVGVKLLEEFVKIESDVDKSEDEGSDESDDTVKFDSDEYENAMLNEEFEFDSSHDLSGEDNSDEEGSVNSEDAKLNDHDGRNLVGTGKPIKADKGKNINTNIKDKNKIKAKTGSIDNKDIDIKNMKEKQFKKDAQERKRIGSKDNVVAAKKSKFQTTGKQSAKLRKKKNKK